MWQYVGPSRDADGLARALKRIQEMRQRDLNEVAVSVDPAYNAELAAWFELRAALLTAEAVTVAALARPESRGAHQRSDFPDLDDQWCFTQSAMLSSGSVELGTIERGA